MLEVCSSGMVLVWSGDGVNGCRYGELVVCWSLECVAACVVSGSLLVLKRLDMCCKICCRMVKVL